MDLSGELLRLLDAESEPEPILPLFKLENEDVDRTDGDCDLNEGLRMLEGPFWIIDTG